MIYVCILLGRVVHLLCKQAGVISAAGVTASILIHTLAAALGLAVLLQTSAVAFWVLKVAGGFYLIYLGYRMIKNKGTFELTETGGEFDTKKCFLQGFLSNVLNPKVAMFFVAFLPQFVSLENSDHILYIVGLGLLFALMTVIFLVILGLFAGKIGSWLQKNKRIASNINTVTGSALVFLGLRLLTPEQN